MTGKILPPTKRYNRQATRHYNTNAKAWKDIRQKVLVRDCYTCQSCKRLVAKKGEAHVDHKDNDTSNNHLHNLQTLCVQCHGRKTHQDMYGYEIKGTDEDGYPCE